MATTSQKMIEIKFLVRMRGALTPPPMIEVPVMKIPLCMFSVLAHVPVRSTCVLDSYHAAPTTDSPMQRAIPEDAQAYGDIDSMKAPNYPTPRQPPALLLSSHASLTLNASPSPLNSISVHSH